MLNLRSIGIEKNWTKSNYPVTLTNTFLRPDFGFLGGRKRTKFDTNYARVALPELEVPYRALSLDSSDETTVGYLVCRYSEIRGTRHGCSPALDSCARGPVGYPLIET
jgi:hypothetical protein